MVNGSEKRVTHYLYGFSIMDNLWFMVNISTFDQHPVTLSRPASLHSCTSSRRIPRYSHPEADCRGPRPAGYNVVSHLYRSLLGKVCLTL